VAGIRDPEFSKSKAAANAKAKATANREVAEHAKVLGGRQRLLGSLFAGLC
jgi:hypothetical protein